MMRTTLGPDDLDRLSATLRQANADFEASRKLTITGRQ